MVWFILLSVVTCGLALGMPPSQQTLHQMHISSLTYRIAVLALLVPYVIIWYAAFYAFAKLKEYVQSIKGFNDGEAFRDIMIGMGVLAFALVVPTAFGLIVQYFVRSHPEFKASSIIIENYIGLVAAITSFIYFSNGSHKLLLISKKRPTVKGLRAFVLLFTVLGVVFTYLITNYHTKHNLYYLNTPLLICTFIIPSLYAWYAGLWGAFEISTYTKYAKGLLYRSALTLFSYGVVVTIAGSVATQFLDNTIAVKASKSLGSTVILDYIVLVIYAVGLILMALGTKRLKKIEEV
jgi:hypothetical protein